MALGHEDIGLYRIDELAKDVNGIEKILFFKKVEFFALENSFVVE